MRSFLLWLASCGLVACGSAPSGQGAPPPPTPVARVEPEPPPPSSCLQVGTPIDEPGLFWVHPIGEVSGTTWATIAQSKPSGHWSTEVIALNAASDGLVRVDLEAELLASLTGTAIDGTGVRIVWLPNITQDPQTSEPARTLRVDVSNPDAPRRSSPAALPDMPIDGWIGHTAADRARLIVSFTAATADRGRGQRSVHLFDLATSARTGEWSGQDATAVFCRGVCGFVTTSAGSITLTVDAGGASHRESIAIDDVCATFRFDTDDETVLVAASAAQHAGWAVKRDGQVRRLPVESWPPDQIVECGDVVRMGSDYIFDTYWVRWEQGLVLSEVELGDAPRRTYASLGDGFVELGVDVVRHMQHSPTDSRGVRRYFHRWQLSGGTVALHGFAEDDPSSMAVPFAPGGGMGDAPTFALLRRGGSVVAFAAAGPVAPSQLIRVIRPCP